MKRFYIIASLLIGAVAFSACEEKLAEPVLNDPTEFVLNNPVLMNQPCDLAKSDYIELVCSQPDYGFTAATTYQVQVSLDGKFENAFDAKKITGDHVTIGVNYTNTRINVSAAEIAIALTQLRSVILTAEDPDITEDEMKAKFPFETPAYVRVKASLSKSGKGEIYSNVVNFKNLNVPYSLPEVFVPKELFIVGQYNGWDWGTAFDFIPAYDNKMDGKGKEGTFWRILYLPEGGFKVNAAKVWDGGEVGYVKDDPLFTYKDNANSGLTASDDGNMVVTKAGWYIVVARLAVDGRDIKYTFEINEPNVYLIGSVAGMTDWATLPEWKFTVPADADGEFVSPAFIADAAADSGVRACVNIGIDWWKTEFMIFGGKIEYRGTGGDQERVLGNKGQKLYLNFTEGTGSIK